MPPEHAARLRSFARQLEQLELVTLVRSSGVDVWTGPTAVACTNALTRHRSTMLHAVDQLRALARHFDQQASE
jgi:hypothetical protein